MPKKKLVVSLKPIKAEIKKAQQALRGIRSQVAKSELRSLELEITGLDNVSKQLLKVCHGIMTHAFAPGEEVEKSKRRR